jgi:Peptidase family M28
MMIDTFAEAARLVDDFGPRGAGTDAERRAAAHLAGRLGELGREVETESFSTWPGWPLAYALHAGLGIAGSALAVDLPVAGAALALAAVLLTLLDASGVLLTTRRLFGRRASQNVVSWGDRDEPGALLLVAHYDTGRGGFANDDAARMRLAAIGQLLRRPVSPLGPFFWSLVAVLVCCLARLADLSGTWLSVIQFVPTVVLIVSVPLLLDIALSAYQQGENDNASGVALALRLAERADPERFGVHVVLTGSQKAFAQGMRAFLRRHRNELTPERTVVLNLDEVGDGEPRYTRREGSLPSLRSHPQLVRLCDAIAERTGAASLVNRAPSDGYAARSAGVPALTVSCRDERGWASRRLNEEALRAAEVFCLALIGRLDDEIGPELPGRADETALSES